MFLWKKKIIRNQVGKKKSIVSSEMSLLFLNESSFYDHS